MKRFFLDTSALLTLRDDEPGAQRVTEVLHLTEQGKAKCYGCFMSLIQVLYRVWRDENRPTGLLTMPGIADRVAAQQRRVAHQGR